MAAFGWNDRPDSMEYARIIRQVVQRLQDENLEQQNNIVPLRPYSGLPALITGLFERRTKQLPVDRLVDRGQRVAVLVDFVQSVLQVKKARLDHGLVSIG